MTLDLPALIRRPTWSKDVCVWIGTEATLGKALEGEKHELLDLLDLLRPDEDMPTDEAGRAGVMESRLDSHLQTLKESLAGRLVLVVDNAALLARYRVGLKPFYDWFGSDRRMTILTLASETQFRIPLHLQRDVKCDCTATVEYLTSCLVNPRLVFREKP